MSEEFKHVPVLAREVAELLTFPEERPARMIDGTVGGGGHSALLLRKYPRLELIGIDRDDAALEKAAETLAFAGDRVRLVRGNYSELASIAAGSGWETVDGVLLDIGVSSPQLDRAERGFSWRAEGPLDMRMDRRSGVTASRLLNQAPEEELERMLTEAMPAEAVLSRARELGVSERTLMIAKKNLGVISEKRGSQWYWRLPAQGCKDVTV